MRETALQSPHVTTYTNVGSALSQDIANDFLGDKQSLFRLFQLGLDYSEICMPIFHLPTLKLSTLPAPLILAICSLGACVSDDRHARETGQLIHSHVWRRMFLKAMESRQVDIPTLQTMYQLSSILGNKFTMLMIMQDYLGAHWHLCLISLSS